MKKLFLWFSLLVTFSANLFAQTEEKRIERLSDLIVPRGEALKTAQKLIAENKFVSTRQKNSAALVAQVSQKDKTYPEAVKFLQSKR